MKKKTVLILLIFLLLVLLCAASVYAFFLPEKSSEKQITEVPVTTAATQAPVPTEQAAFVWKDTPTHQAFRQALKTIHDELYLPKLRIQIDLWEPGTIEDEKFAVSDVDGDGEEELLVFIGNTYIAGMCEVIYGFDSQKNALFVELINFPSITHYPGMLKISASHNHGYAGDVLWPYTVATYNREKDIYEDTYLVDAWDKTLRDYDPIREMAYPEEIDTQKDGFVYVITENGQERFLNRQDYETWESALFDGKEPLTIPWMKMTEENIAM